MRYRENRRASFLRYAGFAQTFIDVLLQSQARRIFAGFDAPQFPGIIGKPSDVTAVRIDNPSNCGPILTNRLVVGAYLEDSVDLARPLFLGWNRCSHRSNSGPLYPDRASVWTRQFGERWLDTEPSDQSLRSLNGH